MSVTTDHTVLKGWPKIKAPIPAVQAAAALGLTVFQITARLKGMEGRGFLVRDMHGNWTITPQGISERENPSPSMSGAHKQMRVKDSTGQHSGPPDDTDVPHLRLVGADWAGSDEQFKECQQRLPVVQQQLAHYRQDATRFRREIMALMAEYDHCSAVLKRSRKGKWTSRTHREQIGEHQDGTPKYHAQTLYIAPDLREYVIASPYETADLLIDSKVQNVPPSRLRLFVTSSAAKAGKRAKATAQEQEKRVDAKQEERNTRVREAEAETAKEAEAVQAKRPARSRSKDRQRTAKGATKLHSGGDRRGTAPSRRKKGRK